MTESALRLVVLGDSTAFTDNTGPRLPGTAHLYPTRLAATIAEELGQPVETTVIARAGMMLRDAVRLTTKDQHVMFEVLPGADIVVIHQASLDVAPGGIPRLWELAVPHLRPARLRRPLRTAMTRAYPLIVRATRGRMQRTPQSEVRKHYTLLLTQVRGLTRGKAASVVLAPTSHNSPYYGHVRPRLADATADIARIAADHRFAFVPCWEHVEPFTARFNEDGIHWPPEAHEVIASELAKALLPQLTGERPTPGLP
ncbi:MAG: SGNH/GDSL hydrolase family protein [Nitriliruptorales bacterium]|nr:SGNH/GDSL hydrolase family protein [Nitriliruptorales bacterium]